MYTMIKILLATLMFAILGVAVYHVTSNANVIDSTVVASTLPALKNSGTAGSSSRDPVDTSDTTATDDFQKLKEHLQAARSAATAMPGYTAILELQEEVDDELRPVDRIEFKTRREPFSVYMRWADSEQEALYVHGENHNRLIVRPTKGLAAIRRVWRLDPDCRMAKQTCRYPITDAGIENLVSRIQLFYDEHRGVAALADCKMEQSTYSDQDVVVFHINFKDEATVHDYSASRYCFDAETKLLIAVDNYGWPKDDKPRLIEHYFYDQIEVLAEPHENVFAEENPEYHFVAR